MIHDAIFAGAGFVIGAFCPAVLRKIKSLFVKESTAAVSSVESSVGSAVKKAL